MFFLFSQAIIDLFSGHHRSSSLKLSSVISFQPLNSLMVVMKIQLHFSLAPFSLVHPQSHVVPTHVFSFPITRYPRRETSLHSWEGLILSQAVFPPQFQKINPSVLFLSPSQLHFSWFSDKAEMGFYSMERIYQREIFCDPSGERRNLSNASSYSSPFRNT